MKNLNTLLMGQTGSGKTTFARIMLGLAPRAFVFDPVDDYEDGAVFYDFDSAADFFTRNAREDFHLIYRGDRSTYVAWLDILFRAQKAETLPPIAVIMEESSFYSTSHVIGEILDTIYTKGRRQRISVLTVVQRTTQINPIIRANSQLWISMQQRNFPSDVKEVFNSDDIETIRTLETFTPVSGPPIEGKHYVTDRPGFPVFEAWKSVLEK